MTMSIVLAAVAGLAVQHSGPVVDLSPARWDPDTRARAEAREQAMMPAADRAIDGGGAVVSATMSPIAVQAGMEALRQGGTAADAAVTVALTQVATSLGSVVSYAGIAQLTYFEATTGEVHGLDAGWGAYAGENDPRSIPGMDLSLITDTRPAGSGRQGRKTLVPGFMAGMEAAHRRFGRLPWDALLQPSIWYARNGVTVSPLLASLFAMREPAMTATADGRRFLAQSGQDRPVPGGRFVQQEVAELLENVAQQGAAYMYDGPWARTFVARVQEEGGAASLEDLRGYTPVWQVPLSVSYGAATVFGPGPSSVSSCTALQSLNLLDAASGSLMGPYWSDPAAFQTYSEITRFATVSPYLPGLAEFERSQGWPSTCEARLSPRYAAGVQPLLNTLVHAPADPAPGHHSAAVVVVDRWGNVAALVHTINAVMWGDTGIVVGGIPLSGAAGLHQERLQGLEAGRHVPGDMAPLIALRDGRPVAAVAVIGTANPSETVRLMAGLLQEPGDPLALVRAPPLFFNFEAAAAGTPVPEQPVLVPQDAYPDEFLDAVRARGLTLQVIDPARSAALRGTGSVAIMDPVSGRKRTWETPGVITFGDAQ